MNAKRWAAQIMADTLGLGMLIVGYGFDQLWAQRLFVFFTWWQVLAAITVAASKSTQAAMRERGRLIPAWWCHGTDLVVVLTLIAIGHPWLAVAWVFQSMITWETYLPEKPAPSDATP